MKDFPLLSQFSFENYTLVSAHIFADRHETKVNCNVNSDDYEAEID